MLEKESFEHTVAHELVRPTVNNLFCFIFLVTSYFFIFLAVTLQVHAYDVCRAQIDFKDCAQHACTEVCIFPVCMHCIHSGWCNSK